LPCALAIPGKVEEISTDGLIRIGRVNFGGVVKNVCLDYVPEVEVGDYTIVHVGFAISKIDEETAEQTWPTSARWACSTKSWPAKKKRLRARRSAAIARRKLRKRAAHAASLLTLPS
jgi:hydrogenase expression/formation protein HypC